MKNEQLSTKLPLDQGENVKDIKDFLNFNENECKTYPNLQNIMKSVNAKMKAYSTKCLHKEFSEILH